MRPTLDLGSEVLDGLENLKQNEGGGSTRVGTQRTKHDLGSIPSSHTAGEHPL